MKTFLLFLLLTVAAFAQRPAIYGPGVTSGSSPTFNIVTATGYVVTLNTLAYAATTDIVMTNGLNTVTLAGNITFTTSAKAAGQFVTVRVVGDGSNRTLAFPGTWVWVGSTPPATLLANKVGLLSLVTFGTGDSDVVASWASSL